MRDVESERQRIQAELLAMVVGGKTTIAGRGVERTGLDAWCLAPVPGDCHLIGGARWVALVLTERSRRDERAEKGGADELS